MTKVLASREDVNSLYVTFSGYRYGEDDGHVYKSTDSGENWLDISEGLPDIPINDIVQDQYGNLFLGTDIGVLSSLDDGANWEPFGENMPSVVINDLFIHEASEYMYAATYGRSSYKWTSVKMYWKFIITPWFQDLGCIQSSIKLCYYFTR